MIIKRLTTLAILITFIVIAANAGQPVVWETTGRTELLKGDSRGVSISDMSRSPLSDMFKVRGIGVAESVNTSTRFFICFKRSLWATPNRCSSSTTTKPRF